MSGYTDRTGPNGASGDRATATPIASSDPADDGAHRRPTKPVGHGHAGPGTQARARRHSSAMFRRTSRLIDLAVDHQRGQRCDQPEEPDRDGFGPDGALGLRHVRRPRGGACGGSEIRDDLVHGRDHRRLTCAAAVEMQRGVGVVGAARLEPLGQRGGDDRHLVAQRGVVVLDDLGLRTR